ncbi:SRPBCC domain-containing protein [Streptomyces albicerus]|jgi:uncharacterized protein YndB with AHSA1/START domain|uniref:SRPBCC domain-containing protein n=1 Tax=Streptomyces albicerus TaxID=2569859 RepID=UPI00124BBED8|nr:SRPBCC domain-containing protein [Streptomyces albicerus]
MAEVIERGTSETRGDRHILHFVLRLPHPVENVWPAVAHPEGLRQWLAAADPFEPRLGGAVALRWLNADGVVTAGRITAWDVERVAEYTTEDFHGRIRFHLEPWVELGTILRFTNEFDGDDALRLDCLAAWHMHLEYLAAALSGRPTAWKSWTPDRFLELRESYAESGS